MTQISPLKGAFSLVELLVVVTCSAVLMAIVMPIFLRARARSVQTSCSTNLHQATMAVSLYAQDNEGSYPDSRRHMEGYWIAQVETYAKGSLRGLFCPSIDRSLFQSPFELGFARNGCVTIEGAIASPSTVFQLAEASGWRSRSGFYSPFTHLSFPDSVRYSDEALAVTHEQGDPVLHFGAARHGGKGNYSFLDGHVKLLGARAIRYALYPVVKGNACDPGNRFSRPGPAPSFAP